MGGHKQKKKVNLNWATQDSYGVSNRSAPARNMRKTDLGSVIFGCKNSTINECLSNQLFGLPEGHFSYIKNISQGLVLFLFNYSDRTLHGIFEAAGPGQMNIDRYAWVEDGDETGYTNYPAQVRMRVRQECQPLSEKQFGPVIANNYYADNKHFYFELDHDQTKQLVSLFRLKPVNVETYPQIPTRHANQSWESSSATSVLGENVIQTSMFSYASVVGDTSATTSSLPTKQWSSLFKTESTVDEQSGVQDSNVSFSASDARVDKAEIPQENTWDEPESIWNGQADTWNGQGETWDGQADNWGEQQTDTWQEQQADTWEEQQANTWEENQPIATVDEVKTWEDHSQHIATATDEIVETTDSGGEHLDMPSSSTQPSIANLDPIASVADESEESFTESDSEETEKKDNSIEAETVEEQDASNDLQSLVVKLMQEVKELKGSHMKQLVKFNVLEKELVESKQEIDQLRTRLGFMDVDAQLLSKSQTKLFDSVYIVGGCDGSGWLSSLDSYFPSHDQKIPLRPMNFVKTYGSAAILNGEIFHFGGGGSHTVESFNPTSNQWTARPPLQWKNICAAGATVNDRLFVVGGTNGPRGTAEVEYLDLNIGMWLPSRAMQKKRLAPAVAELNNALYVSGGFDGASYLSSVERFDPREEAWHNLPSMNRKKGCHSMVVLNKKLYSLGGFDGDNYIATVECFDTRMSSWVEAEPMNVSRGSFGAFVMGEKLYAIGGATQNNELLDIAECYNEGSRWETVVLKAIGKRSHFAAIVM